MHKNVFQFNGINKIFYTTKLKSRKTGILIFKNCMLMIILQNVYYIVIALFRNNNCNDKYVL